MNCDFIRTEKAEKWLRRAQISFFVAFAGFLGAMGYTTSEKKIITMGRYDVNGDGVKDALVFTEEGGDFFLDYYDGRYVKEGDYGLDNVIRFDNPKRIDTDMPLNSEAGKDFRYVWFQDTDDNGDGKIDSKDYIDLKIYPSSDGEGRPIVFENIFDGENRVKPRTEYRGQEQSLLRLIK